MIDSGASFIHAEYPFALEVIVIDDQLTYLEVALSKCQPYTTNEKPLDWRQ